MKNFVKLQRQDLRACDPVPVKLGNPLPKMIFRSSTSLFTCGPQWEFSGSSGFAEERRTNL
ncbi:hypothetical protein N7507_009255 [Penicillium longicatenatum]|nr:hypothetical protein N7507_009255 [Penicillium longicatenatum]